MAVLMKEMFGVVRPNTTMCECDFLVISQRDLLWFSCHRIDAIHSPDELFSLRPLCAKCGCVNLSSTDDPNTPQIISK